MKDQPIIFRAQMVRAILAGRKTQTRRKIDCPAHAGIALRLDAGGWISPVRNDNGEPAGLRIRPKYRAGMRLWVKEAFSECGVILQWRADGEDQPKTGPWKSPLFMPRRASRITLAVKTVRVERLNDISIGDCRAEGCGTAEIPWCTGPLSINPWRNTYAHLWESINGPGSWAENPWVYVLDFEKVLQPK